MKLFKMITTSILASIMGAGVIGVIHASNIDKNVVETKAASEEKTCITIELRDKCYATDNGRYPYLHLWGLDINPIMGFGQPVDLIKQLSAANFETDLHRGTREISVNADKNTIDLGFNKVDTEGETKIWRMSLPWYFDNFDFKIYTREYTYSTEWWAQSDLEFTAHGSYVVSLTGSWDSYENSIDDDPSEYSNVCTVNTYKYITSAIKGYPKGSGNPTAKMYSNDGEWVDEAYFYERQKVMLTANSDGNFVFSIWRTGKNIKSASDNFIYTQENNGYSEIECYFYDNTWPITVNFYNDDRTTLVETAHIHYNQYVECSVTPTKAPKDGKEFEFKRWENENGYEANLRNVCEDSNFYASYYSYSLAGRYLVGHFGDCDWGMTGSVYMNKFNDYEYNGDITLAYGDVFKCAYYDKSSLSSYFGYSSITTSSGAYNYFSNDADDNIVCYARGTYRVYFTDGDYGEGKKMSIVLVSDLTSEHLAAKLMGFGENPESGHCGESDHFPAMRSMYLSLSGAEQETFQGYASSSVDQFKNAYNRYINWAKALGENPWANEKASSNFAPLSIVDNGDSSTFIIMIVVTSLSFTSLLICLYHHKKRRIR